MSRYGPFICLACGVALPEVLQRLASLRCHDCRALDEPLHIDHARRQRATILERGGGIPPYAADAA